MTSMRDRALHSARSMLHVIPRPLRVRLLSMYHRAFAYLGALLYRSPSKKLFVVAVTGTKGKTTVTEILNAVFEEAGYTTVLSNTIRFKAGKRSRRNLRKMTMPGRFFLQSLLREGVNAGATHAVIEMTSEGALQHRHEGVALDALIFTNLSPEHIESHGSFEAYGNAKLRLGTALERSVKRPRTLVAIDDAWGHRFLMKRVEHKIPFTLADAAPYGATFSGGTYLTVQGVKYESHLPGEANTKNLLAVIVLARSLGIAPEVIQRALKKLTHIPGRFENVNEGGDFPVIVDYAHTPESLEELYKTFEDKRCICVLGGTGGGRDTWKRPKMGALAEKYCDTVILTNEDPYDEDPEAIINDLAKGMRRAPTIILDRGDAIREAVRLAHMESAVLITGKGTDPYIMGAKGAKLPWSDADTAREALKMR